MHSFICGLSGGFGVQFFTSDTLKAYLDSGNIETPHPSIIALLEPYVSIYASFFFSAIFF